MGEEKPELSEGKLSSQSGYSPVKQVDPNEILEEGDHSNSDKPKSELTDIPRKKKGNF